MKVVALSGGVGGAKLLLGLYKVLPAGSLTAIVNVADDFEWYGLHISPDLDTALYALSGLSDYERGWGIAGDTFNGLSAFRRLGENVWFSVGDQDLSTHILRTLWLSQGVPLSQVTARFVERLKVGATILPATDGNLRTWIRHRHGVMPFQEYFVLHRAEVEVERVEFEGERVEPAPGVLEAIADCSLLVIGPSNPVVSIWPILKVKNVAEAVGRLKVPRVAVTPIVAGKAVTGPAGRLLAALGYEVSPLGVAQFYRGFISHIVIHRSDEMLAPELERMGLRVLATDVIMKSLENKKRLAEEILAWVRT